jgi:hypothetical protein
MKRRWVIALALLLPGCDDSSTESEFDTAGGLSDEMPEDLPAGGCEDEPGDCETDGAGESSSGGVDAAPQDEAAPCELSGDCDGAGACVAAYEDGERGAFECRFACVPTLDEAAWCGDDASCCDPQATCTARGYCVVVGPEDRSGSDRIGGPTFSDTMPEDLPAGGGTPPESMKASGS